MAWAAAFAVLASPLHAQRPETAPAQPREPTEVELTLPSSTDGVSLAGTLTLPAGPGPHPAAVLLSVAGPNDRNQTMPGGVEPFRALARGLALRGVATLRWDDRGVGGSGGDVLQTTVELLAEDALAAVDHLAARDEIDPDRVGAIGNSEGALVAARAAADSGRVAFAVLLGGSGVPGFEVIRERLLRSGIRRGLPPDRAEALLAPFDSLAAAVVGEPDRERRRERIRALFETTDIQLPAYGFVPTDADARIEFLAGPWYRSQLGTDPGAVLPRIRVPVLALSGSADRLNLPEQNLPAIARHLAAAPTDAYAVEMLPGLDHFMRPARGDRDGPVAFSPRAVDAVADWLERTLPATAPPSGSP